MSLASLHQAYSSLPNHFYQEVRPDRYPNAHLIVYNHDLAHDLGLDHLSPREQVALASGDVSQLSSKPIALAYAGHQFGHFNPGLGDGRAAVIGEVQTKNGSFDLQLKGSGRTPYSRNGDGKSALGPVLREYLVSEAMHALGIPTTRSLAAVTTGTEVYREEAFAGGILTRVAASHLRLGTFELYAYQRDEKSLETLLSYACQRHYPHLEEQQLPLADKAVAFWQAVAQRQAKLVAQWMSVGFIHGVMNTDNMTISGETIDYGPCAFMDYFEHRRVYSYIDRGGRYAYAQQIPIAQWNLARLGECLIPLINPKQPAQAVELMNDELSHLPQLFNSSWSQEMLAKFGLAPMPLEQAGKLITPWLNYLEGEKLDFTLSYRKLAQELFKAGSTDLPKGDQFQGFMDHLRQEITRQQQMPEHTAQLMDQKNPTIIPRNHDIETVIERAYEEEWEPFHAMLAAVMRPFDEHHSFHLPPTPSQVVANTFCGT